MCCGKPVDVNTGVTRDRNVHRHDRSRCRSGRPDANRGVHGGNAGTETLTIAVRALATKEQTEANAWRLIRREVNVGLLNGLMFAAISGLVDLIWFGSPVLGAVLELAMIGNLFVAGLAGIFVPLGLDRFGLDPALASGVFVTTVTDVFGLFCFLALAALILV